MQSCCTTGFRWKGTPKGVEKRIEGNDVYVTGDKNDKAILFIADGFGWKLNNNRLLADHFAEEIGATVYIPDFFYGTGIDDENLQDPGELAKFLQTVDWPRWLSENKADKRMPAVLGFAKHLRQQYQRLAAVGYCWGGCPALRIAAKEHSGLVDCISIAHPSSVTEDDLKHVGVPVQILAPEHDKVFTPELKQYANAVIPTLGINYSYQYFPGLEHGFATRCDESNEREKKALELAKNAMVYWLSSHTI